MNDCSKKVLHKLSQSASIENKVSFADAVQGKEKRDVAQFFSAILNLVKCVVQKASFIEISSLWLIL